MSFSRREFLAAMAAGGMVVAGDLWVPGEKLISIPRQKIWTFDDAPIVNRLYGYDDGGNYSWGRHVREMRNGTYLGGEVIRISGVDITTDEMAAHDMERRLEQSFERSLLA